MWLKETSSEFLYSVAGLGVWTQPFVATSQSGRRLLCDALLTDTEFQYHLRHAVVDALSQINLVGATFPADGGQNHHVVDVLYILRGGLNFGLQEASRSVYRMPTRVGFLARERRVVEGSVYLNENMYDRLDLRDASIVVVADICATGATMISVLKYVLTRINGASICHFVIIVVGAREAAINLNRFCENQRSSYPKTSFTLVFLEGVFSLCHVDMRLQGHLPATDFLRAGGAMAPEFLVASYADPIIPLERCVIYDGGLRGFDGLEHLRSLGSYWRQMYQLYQKKPLEVPRHVREKTGISSGISFPGWREKHSQWLNISSERLRTVYDSEVDLLQTLEDVPDILERCSQHIARIRIMAEGNSYEGDR